MAGLIPITKDQLVTVQTTQYAAIANDPLLTGEGEPLGDVFQANAIMLQLIDANIQYINNKSRLSTTSNNPNNPDAVDNPDIDSFCAPFGIIRDPAVPATGQVTITPNSAPSFDLFIVLGSVYSTSTGLNFQVIADTTQTAYVAGSGYRIPAGSSSAITATVQCTTAGSVGNVQAATITGSSAGLGTPPPAPVTVTNGNAFTSGVDGEKNSALVARFQQTIISGRWSTPGAVGAAIESAEANLVYEIAEGFNSSGSTDAGFFSVFVNISQPGVTPGTTPAATLAAVSDAILAVKPCGVTYGVYSPTITSVTLSCTIHYNATYAGNPATPSSSIQAAVIAAWKNYVNNLPISIATGTTLVFYSKVSALLYAIPGVDNVSSLLINSGTSDITAGFGVQLVAGAATVTMTTP